MPSRFKRLALFIASITMFVTIWGAPVAGASSDAQRLLSLINSVRGGLGPLTMDGTLNAIAQSHAQRMAAAGRIFHNSSYPAGAGSYNSYGENVGTSSNVDAVHRAFMQSSMHRSNILKGSYNLVGIGVAPWSGGVMVVEDFIGRSGVVVAAPTRPRQPVHRAAEPPSPPPPPPPPPPKVERPLYERMGRWESFMESELLPAKSESLSPAVRG